MREFGSLVPAFLPFLRAFRGRGAAAWGLWATASMCGAACGGRTTMDAGAAGGEVATDDSAVGGAGMGAADTGADTGGDGAGGAGTLGCELVRTEKNVVVSTQADLEALRGVRLLEGTLSITGTVEDLSPLSCLTEITEDLAVYEAENLADLDGLERLTTIGGALYIGHYCYEAASQCSGNPVLESIDALRNLVRANKVVIAAPCFGEGQDEDCAYNAALEEVAFGNLVESTTIELRANPVLKVARFDDLENVWSLSAIGNEALTTLSFERLSTVDTLELRGALALASLSGFEQLQSARSVQIIQSGILDFTGFSNAQVQILELYDNPMLGSFAGLDSFVLAESMLVQGNDALQDLSGLEALEVVDGKLELTLNSKLESLSGLINLERAGTLFIQSNYGLADLGALPALTSVGGLELWNNDALASVDGLETLTQVDHVSLTDNAVLADLHGLDAIAEVSDYVSISYNPSLPTCEAERLLDQIGEEHIGGAVQIVGNDDASGCPE